MQTDRAPSETTRQLKQGAQAVLGVLLLLFMDRATDMLLQGLGLKFPSFVAAMLLLFGGLTLGRALSSRVVDRFAELILEARTWLSRWMALFFVPPLVLIQNMDQPAPVDLLALAFLGFTGFIASFWLAGSLASWASSETPLARSNSHARGSAPWPRRVLLFGWGTVSVLSAAALAFGHATIAKCAFGVAICAFGFVSAEGLRSQIDRRGFHAIALFFHPVLVSAGLVVLAFGGMNLETRDFLTAPQEGLSPGGLLVLLLRPAVVALAFALDEERQLLFARSGALILSTGLTAVLSLFGTALAASFFGLNEVYASALVSRSVTTPVALAMADLLGANAGLTAVIVVLTGVLGAVLTAPLGRRFGFTSAFALGVATGASSHGIGTSALARDNPSAAGFSGIAFALTAIFSVGLVAQPWFRALLLGLL